MSTVLEHMQRARSYLQLAIEAEQEGNREKSRSNARWAAYYTGEADRLAQTQQETKPHEKQCTA